jgi:transposase
MTESYNRYDISDKLWSLIEPHTIGNKGTWGGNAKDTRLFIDGVLWILRTGAPWRDLPPTYGKWSTVHRRFCRWRDKNIWENIFLAIIGEDECEWLLIDASFVKAHKDAHGAIGGSQDIGRSAGIPTKPALGFVGWFLGGLHLKSILPWMRLVVRSELLSQQVQLMIVKRLMS